MLQATIENNCPLCPECKFELGDNAVDVFLAETENEVKFFEFHRRCKKCGKKVKYYVETSFEYRTSLDEESVTRVTTEFKREKEFEDE